MTVNIIEQTVTVEQALETIEECFSVLEKVSKLDLEPEAHENFREIAFRVAFAKKVLLSNEHPEKYKEQALVDVDITKKCCDQLKDIV